MWTGDWRDRAWEQLNQAWDIVVIGGGITGAGILREATRLGLRTLLVEQRDFAWGTSSRSSKLVHGGLRYLKEGQWRLTRASVRERKRLLDEGAGLIEPLGFLIATYRGDRPGRWTYKAGLSVYDLLALQWSHQHYKSEDFQMLAPHLAQDGLTGGYRYGDAQTDDARLVLRVLQEAVAAGGTALNYVSADDLLLSRGRVAGVALRDMETGRTAEVQAGTVINATGAWSDRLRGQVGAQPRLRPLRGSHLVFAAWQLPVAQALAFLHPADRRPVFIYPWEGITLVGTTDVDHGQPTGEEPSISRAEADYLMAGVEWLFPSRGLKLAGALASFAGVRPVIGGKEADPSKESRDHVVWHEDGLLTVTGGKLTTFRLIAHDALKAVRAQQPGLPRPDEKAPMLDPLDPLPCPSGLTHLQARRLSGRCGAAAGALLAASQPGELETIPGTPAAWAELRWAARAEAVCHLDDLLLRRVRLGLLLPGGGEELLPRVRAICQPELGWRDRRWEAEAEAYLELWHRCYSVPVERTEVVTP